MIELNFYTRLFFAAFACYRLAQFIPLDNGPWFVFDHLREWVRARKVAEHDRWLTRENRAAGDKNRGPWATIDELTTCPFCQGPWWAVAVVALLVWPSVGGDVFLLWMGITGVQTWLQSERER